MLKVCGRVVLAALVAAMSLVGTAHADGLGPGDFFHDAGAYFTAPLYWDEQEWLYFGGALAAIGAAHTLDTTVRDHFAGSHPDLNGQDPNSTRDAAPAAALLGGVWLVSTVVGDDAGKGESYTMLEATIFSGVTAEGLKYAAGRAGPNTTLDANDWRASGSSFPSLHTTAAFAVGTVFAESGDDDYRWFRRIVGYGIAGATAYLRLHDNQHWFSDVVAGSALGIASAHFSMDRRLERLQQHNNLSISVMPIVGGAKLTVSLNLD